VAKFKHVTHGSFPVGTTGNVVPALILAAGTPLPYLGAAHKVRHARGGEGVREGVTVCDRGEGGQEHVTSRLYKFLSYI